MPDRSQPDVSLRLPLMQTITAPEVINAINPFTKSINVIDQRGRLAFAGTVRQIMTLAGMNGIVGMLNRKGALNHVRLTISARRARQAVGKGGTLPVAEDNRTITRQRLTFSHHPQRCAAYGRAA